MGYLGKVAFAWKFGLNDLPQTVYEPTVWGRAVVKAVGDLGNVTRVKTTPDEWTMLATTLDGKVWALNNVDNTGQYVRQAKPLYQIPLGWTPGSENGMTGLAISYDFVLDHYVFISYAKKVGATGRNYIDRLELERIGDAWAVKNVRNIFVGNTPVVGAHQIQGMIAIPVEDQLHIMFTVGEGYMPEHAQDLRYEAGKIMLVKADGGDPLGIRPYPDHPRIQAVGIRNAYDLARNEVTNWIYVDDNGPDANDRIIYAPLLDPTKEFDFGWDGTDASMLHPKVDGKPADELVVHVWPTTVSPAGMATDTLGRLYVTTFSASKYPYKEIWMGEVKNNKAKMTKIVSRRADAAGGNLIGVNVSNQTGNVWFADFSDGALYVLGRSWELLRVLGR